MPEPRATGGDPPRPTPHGGAETGSLGAPRPVVLTRRADFVRAAQAARASTPGFTLQARARAAGEAEGLRVGFTCSKKVGNAVARNRAKRRLREAARAVLPREGRDGWDYVLVGRPEATAALPFPQLLADLAGALARVHGKG